MYRIKCFFFVLGVFWASDLLAAAQEPPITEDQLQERYNKVGVKAHIYPRQLIALREAFVQKVKVWEEIHGRGMHPIDLLMPHLEMHADRRYNFFKKFDTEFLIGSEEEAAAASPERKNLSRSVVLAFTAWLKASELFGYTKKWFFWEKKYVKVITQNKYDYLFAYQIEIECALIGCPDARQWVSIDLSNINTYRNFWRVKLPEEIKSLPLMMSTEPYISSTSYIFPRHKLLSNNLTEEEFDIVKAALRREPIDFPLYGLREAPPLDPRPGGIEGMWKSLRGIKRPVPACLRDSSVMEGEGPYLDKIPQKDLVSLPMLFRALEMKY